MKSNQKMDYGSISVFKMNIIIRHVILVMIFILSNLLSAVSQGPALKLGNVGACDNLTVLVPITGNNLVDIGAITLYIRYNEDSLSFVSLENIDPQLSGVMVNTLSNPSRISIVWSKTTGANFADNAMLYLKFNVLKQPVNLTFIKEFCEIANVSIPPQIVPVTYTDGYIFPSVPYISSGPEDKTIASQSNAVFQVISPNAAEFSWQEKPINGDFWTDLPESPVYIGTQTNSLTVVSVPAGFNKNRYRCILKLNGCIAITNDAVLTVDSIAGLNTHAKAGFKLSNYPNPFSGSTTLSYAVPDDGLVTLAVISATGTVQGIPLEKHHQAGSYTIEDNFVSLPSGVYFCKLSFKNPHGYYEIYRKMIKLNQY